MTGWFGLYPRGAGNTMKTDSTFEMMYFIEFGVFINC
jgi:hypothetical protein